MTQPWFAVARNIFSHPVVGRKPYCDGFSWLWLCNEAAFQPRSVRVSGRSGAYLTTIKLERGQLSHSLRYMAEAWGWSVKRVRTFLHRLEMEGQIETQTDTGQTVITICNYAIYQNPDGTEGTPKDTPKGTPRAHQGHKVRQWDNETIDSSSSASKKEYAYQGRIIRLTSDDLQRWRSS